MKLWIQTRGQRCDYRFLGSESEPERWWRPYLDYSAPEERMFVCETSASRWRLYATAMPAGRYDSASPPREIRMSLLVEGTPQEARLLEKLLLGWLEGSPLATALRKVLPESQVEQWLALGGQLPVDQLAPLHKAIVELQAATPRPWNAATPNPERGSVSRVNGPELAHVAGTLAREGRNGVFCQLNLLDDGAQPRGIPALAHAACLGLLDRDGKESLLINRDQEASTVPNPTVAGRHQWSTTTRPLSAPMMVIAALMVGLILLYIIMTGL